MKRFCKNCNKTVEVNSDHIDYDKCEECSWIISRVNNICPKCQKIMGCTVTGEPNTSPRMRWFECVCGYKTKVERVR